MCLGNLIHIKYFDILNFFFVMDTEVSFVSINILLFQYIEEKNKAYLLYKYYQSNQRTR